MGMVIMEILFFLAFLSVLWLLLLVVYWVGYRLVKVVEKRGAVEKWMHYREGRGARNSFLCFLFLVLNAHVLFPRRGAVVAVFLIGLFVFVNSWR